MIINVRLSKKALRDLAKAPRHIAEKLYLWPHDVNEFGLEKVRTRPGYNDEPLKGKRQGQRSIRLNRSYRAIYILKSDGTIEFVEVTEVNKHDY